MELKSIWFFIIFSFTTINFLGEELDSLKILEKIREADSKIINIEAVLTSLNENINQLEDELIVVENKKTKITTNIENILDEITKINLKINPLEKLLLVELKTLYILYSALRINLYLSRDYFNNYIRNNHLLNSLQKKTILEIETLNQLKTTYVEQLNELKQTRIKLINSQNEIKSLRQKLYFDQEQKILISKLIKKEKSNLIDQAKLIEQEFSQSRELKPLISENIDAFKGNLILPIIGNMIQNFGARKKGDIKTYSQGVLVRTYESPAKILSITDGQIIRITTSAQGLCNITVNHEKSIIALYSLLTKCNVEYGENIKSGQIIGQINRDNIIGGKIFYFELRINYNAVDPKKWLVNNGWK